jgi:hypothetical protein
MAGHPSLWGQGLYEEAIVFIRQREPVWLAYPAPGNSVTLPKDGGMSDRELRAKLAI